jgi:hypothetical protein
VKVLLISANDLHVPSGIPQMVEQIIGGLLSRGVSVTTVLPKPSAGLSLYKPAREYYESQNGRLAVEWLPIADFSNGRRESLLHNLEGLIAKEDLNRILAVGVRKAGFVSAIAARLRGKLFSAILTYRDAFESHLNAPHELDLVTETARLLIAPNPFVLEHLGCFYNFGDRAYWLEMLPTIANSECFHLEEDLSYRETISASQPYLCTTGDINPRVDVAELLDRVVGLMHEGVAEQWVHVGTTDPNTLMHLSSRLVLLGLLKKFALTGVVDRSRYRCLVQGARVVVKPAGEVDTGVGAIEANGWEIPLSVPPDYPIRPLKRYPPRSDCSDNDRSSSFHTSRFKTARLDAVLDLFLQ